MKSAILKFILSCVGAGTTVAFTQYHRVELNLQTTRPQKSRKRTLAQALGGYDYPSPNLAEEEERELLKSRMPPPRDKNMSKLQIEFRELLEGILYTEQELSTVLNPRLRSILEGITASYYEPAVYRAFEVLYEDYIPLRLAGRVVYRELRKVMEESKQYQESEIDVAATYTGMPRSEIERCWYTFSEVVESRELGLDDLEAYLGPQTMKYVLESGPDTVGFDAKEANSIPFGHLLSCVHNFRIRSGNNGNEKMEQNTFQGFLSSGNLLQQALGLDGNSSSVKSKEQSLSDKRQKFNKRYDDMLVQFSKWKPLIPSGEGRRLDVLKGCFVGSENPAVVEALRIIYVDYRALRLSGDWIFKLVSALMGPIERRHKRRQQTTLQP